MKVSFHQISDKILHCTFSSLNSTEMLFDKKISRIVPRRQSTNFQNRTSADVPEMNLVAWRLQLKTSQ